MSKQEIIKIIIKVIIYAVSLVLGCVGVSATAALVTYNTVKNMADSSIDVYQYTITIKPHQR